MLARVPWTSKSSISVKPKRPKRLTKEHRRRLIDGAAAILRHGEPTKFALEAYCRHGLRSGLCLRGWKWQEADEAAADVVAAALNVVGAKRPSWQAGQPEWCQPGVMALARTRCIRCGWKLPEGNRKFCGSLCHSAHNMAVARANDEAAATATVYAWYAGWSAKQPDQPCEACEASFRPKRPGQRFCSKLCSNRRNSGLRRALRSKKPMRCEAIR
jgi:hypothetical protein